MPFELSANSYGKSRVRLVRVHRGADRHDLKEVTVAVALEGDFADAHLKGDNSRVLPTDTMKNTVFALAGEHGAGDIEDFGLALARHFLSGNAHVSRARITLVEGLWSRLHPHAFEKGVVRRHATIDAARDGERVSAGVDGLSLLKTTDSAFSGFPRDRFTTLKETEDRIFATDVTAHWTYAKPTKWTDSWARASGTLVKTFAGHKSLSVQQTLYAMGEAALAAVPDIAEIRLSLPNRHCLPVDLAPFGIENRNEIFVATDEPHGLIEATIRRT